MYVVFHFIIIIYFDILLLHHQYLLLRAQYPQGIIPIFCMAQTCNRRPVTPEQLQASHARQILKMATWLMRSKPLRTFSKSRTRTCYRSAQPGCKTYHPPGRKVLGRQGAEGQPIRSLSGLSARHRLGLLLPVSRNGGRTCTPPAYPGAPRSRAPIQQLFLSARSIHSRQREDAINVVISSLYGTTSSTWFTTTLIVSTLISFAKECQLLCVSEIADAFKRKIRK